MSLTLPDPVGLPRDDPRTAELRAAEAAAVVQHAEIAALQGEYNALGGLYAGEAERLADELQAEIDEINARNPVGGEPIAAGCTVIRLADARSRRGI